MRQTSRGSRGAAAAGHGGRLVCCADSVSGSTPRLSGRVPVSDGGRVPRHRRAVTRPWRLRHATTESGGPGTARVIATAPAAPWANTRGPASRHSGAATKPVSLCVLLEAAFAVEQRAGCTACGRSRPVRFLCSALGDGLAGMGVRDDNLIVITVTLPGDRPWKVRARPPRRATSQPRRLWHQRQPVRVHSARPSGRFPLAARQGRADRLANASVVVTILSVDQANYPRAPVLGRELLEDPCRCLGARPPCPITPGGTSCLGVRPPCPTTPGGTMGFPGRAETNYQLSITQPSGGGTT